MIILNKLYIEIKMTFKELNFFYKLCENPKVSMVAKELNISQSAISIAIKSLEEKLRESLFDRVGKKLVLNERGRSFYEKTYTHFVALNDAQNIFKIDKIDGTLKVGSSRTISNHFMADIYYNFLSKYEKVKIDIDTINSSLIVKKVLNGELDLGIIESDCEELDIIKEELYEDQLLVVSSDKEYEKEIFIDMIDKKWILREQGSGTREMFINRLGELSKQIDIFMELQEVQEIKELLLKHKDTISVMSKIAVLKEIEQSKLFVTQIKGFSFDRHFYLIYHKNKSRTILFETFTKYLKDCFIKATHK